MKTKKVLPEIPNWIPQGAKGPYRAVYANGGYSDERKAAVLEDLFHSEKLKDFWGSLSSLDLSADGWSFLIGSIVLTTECAPPRQRATREAPDEKVRILEQQNQADRLMAAAAAKARELSELLSELEDNGGELPAGAYSGLALIEAAIQAADMSRACCAEGFEKFKCGLSSYAKNYFPHPILIVDTLFRAFEDFPSSNDLFANEPWLSSRQSSWKDYVRALREQFSECKRMYCAAPQLTDAEWTSLLQVLISSNLSRQTVTKGLKEL